MKSGLPGKRAVTGRGQHGSEFLSSLALWPSASASSLARQLPAEAVPELLALSDELNINELLCVDVWSQARKPADPTRFFAWVFPPRVAACYGAMPARRWPLVGGLAGASARISLPWNRAGLTAVTGDRPRTWPNECDHA